ncbi:glycoside hydrolase 100 family protein [Belliella pelovolcani]|uniref:glycoside hydrolase 100 family protein n=1 Tax=Belliella pelovolcani TaxID=529505 RepID=UPI0039192E12
MDIQIANEKATEVLRLASHPMGFLASAVGKDNYQRIWARDGVITGLAALASRDLDLIATFKATMETLGAHISPQGHVPSNVDINSGDVSYGGLAGRADTGSWWIIGMCLYSKYTGDRSLLVKYKSEIQGIHDLYQAWEYNNKNLIYVPLAGDWADEYILSGYVLYDQVLRFASLKLSSEAFENATWALKAENVYTSIRDNFDLSKGSNLAGIHPSAKKKELEKGSIPYLPASFNPAGYQNYFDALGNALAIIFRIHPNAHACLDWVESRQLNPIPAFYPTILPEHPDYHLLQQNYRFDFRNHPHEFHNGGIWPMVNGFWGMASLLIKGKQEAEQVLGRIIGLNSLENWDFNECFHGVSSLPCGVKACTWSAAGQLLLSHSIYKGFYLID